MTLQTTTSGEATPAWIATPQPGLQINSVAVCADASLTVAGTSSEFGSGQFNFYGWDASGQQLWQVPVTAAATNQGVFWVAVDAAGTVAAAGGETSKTCGFLTIVAARTGAVLWHNDSLPGRVNQLSFSADGSLLLADFANQIQLYSLVNQQWQLSDSLPLDSNYASYSAVLSEDGSSVWLGAINYNVKPYSGLVLQVPVSNGRFGPVVSYSQASGVMRVVTTADGQYAAAALHSGGCAFFQRNQPQVAAFTYQPAITGLSLAYAIAITQTRSGALAIVVGANTQSAGVLYRVDPLMTASQIANYPLWQPELAWTSAVQYAVNPGVTLDKEATRVSATDGKPDEQNGGSNTSESPGNFYLFDACTGTKLWQYGTTLMNWPMQLTPDGQVAVGASDNGSVYYWKL